MHLIVHALSYVHADQELLFRDIHFSLAAGEKAALVGPNGAGKSTLLKIIAGHLKPNAGEVSLPELPYYVPQHLGQYDELTVGEALGVVDKLRALQAILAGDVSYEHFASLNDDWQIEERVAAALDYWHLREIMLNEKMAALSGGEKTKVFLAGISIHNPQVILMDEPSNHLDAQGRRLLYDFIASSPATTLLVSHDRQLLNQLDQTFELTKSGIEAYGGNYDFYKQQKEQKLQALQAQLEEGQKTLKHAKSKARELAEQRQKQESRGKKSGEKQGLPRIVAGGLQRQAEQSTAKLKETHAGKMEDIASNISVIRAKIQEYLPLKIDLRPSDMHFGKMLVEAKEINFAYDEKQLWPQPLSFQLRAGDRVRIEGNNGSGKSTLVKLITGALTPSEGTLQRSEFRYAMIDQEYSMIDEDRTVFEQVRAFNSRELLEAELKMFLHYHQFPRDSWDRPCSGLSGGEKMKLALCCLAVMNNAPDLLILDEPTNNLDLPSQETLTGAVRNFVGSVLLISHDQYFIEQVGITSSIKLS